MFFALPILCSKASDMYSQHCLMGIKFCAFSQLWIIRVDNMDLFFTLTEKCQMVQSKSPLDLYQSPLFLSFYFMNAPRNHVSV